MNVYISDRVAACCCCCCCCSSALRLQWPFLGRKRQSRKVRVRMKRSTPPVADTAIRTELELRAVGQPNWSSLRVCSVLLLTASGEAHTTSERRALRSQRMSHSQLNGLPERSTMSNWLHGASWLGIDWSWLSLSDKRLRLARPFVIKKKNKQFIIHN